MLKGPLGKAGGREGKEKIEIHKTGEKRRRRRFGWYFSPPPHVYIYMYFFSVLLNCHSGDGRSPLAKPVGQYGGRRGAGHDSSLPESSSS